MAILITGGAGYIGSHTLVELANANHDFIVYDNLSNSSQEALKRVEKIIGKSITFINGDIRDTAKLKETFTNHDIDSVIHFAGLKAVGESVAKPLEYYDNNVVGTLRLLEVTKEFGCKKIVFSSSATVYNEVNASNYTPLTESNPTGKTTNPYGTSKYMIERILEDLYISDNTFKIAILRYFNPVGAHESGTIGEDPNGIPNNLMPFISQVAVGKREYLSVFGSDYDTHDGTGVRDYIHVVDLANAHVKAIDYLNNQESMEKPLIANLGTGTGYSVIDVVKAFEKASGKKVAYKLVDRRAGDIAKCYANPSFAKEILGWEATRDLEQMCIDSWRWQSNNPNGYRGKND
ncbi:UDP-glucose 4-epimerase GalE [Aliarcobacter cryaerophilus]|uniref:UDP-glucose 4-epimerase GalE n=1 Tax=Aliarcobacter cryaerophilus TaxID=28198 RepID=UPI0021B5D3A7|nr:UDP-glucose 4-epimerase GalE [Aliarcobacter cryaerophilus]MCT7487135.1 UDP-glucose 4-epimerase GalE [Aliarcobacter cryaerophilus]MCT7491551.1 UDP-glucose 4-epimerase GalE [Aliarcobacter cryaerophilus]